LQGTNRQGRAPAHHNKSMAQSNASNPRESEGGRGDVPKATHNLKRERTKRKEGS
jgi:hypothetical protein